VKRETVLAIVVAVAVIAVAEFIQVVYLSAGVSRILSRVRTMPPSP
jgi:hypothetical protein